MVAALFFGAALNVGNAAAQGNEKEKLIPVTCRLSEERPLPPPPAEVAVLPDVAEAFMEGPWNLADLGQGEVRDGVLRLTYASREELEKRHGEFRPGQPPPPDLINLAYHLVGPGGQDPAETQINSGLTFFEAANGYMQQIATGVAPVIRRPDVGVANPTRVLTFGDDKYYVDAAGFGVPEGASVGTGGVRYETVNFRLKYRIPHDLVVLAVIQCRNRQTGNLIPRVRRVTLPYTGKETHWLGLVGGTLLLGGLGLSRGVRRNETQTEHSVSE